MKKPTSFSIRSRLIDEVKRARDVVSITASRGAIVLITYFACGGGFCGDGGAIFCGGDAFSLQRDAPS